MLVLLEGIALSFIVLLVCLMSIANGPWNGAYLYEDDVKERVVELGLITKEKLQRNYLLAGIALFLPMLILVPAFVVFVNGATGFWDTFVQITEILMIEGLFDRIFIDWYWVGKTKAWVIKGTEDLMPYIPKKVLIKKWIGTLIGYPLIAAILSYIICLF